MGENRKIPQEISGDKLLAILKLWSEFSNWRRQSPPQIVTGILAEEVGLIVNDSIIETSVVTPSSTSPSYPFTTFMMLGKRAGILRVRLYDAGITVDQLNEKPKYEDLFKDPENAVYYTMTIPPVIEATKLLKLFWQQRAFTFVYGTLHFKDRLNTNIKCYVSRENESSDLVDKFVVVKTHPSESEPDTIRSEFIWSTGDIYAIDTPINKPFKHNLIKIQKSLL